MKLLLFFIIAVYLLLRVAKWLLTAAPGEAGPEDPRSLSIDDVMLKDPVCGTYFPRREGVVAEQDGEVHRFCSSACRDRFLEERKASSNH
ncbi:MAG: hypothetical protein R6W95_12575 [Desulfosarcina sp.]